MSIGSHFVRSALVALVLWSFVPAVAAQFPLPSIDAIGVAAEAVVADEALDEAVDEAAVAEEPAASLPPSLIHHVAKTLNVSASEGPWTPSGNLQTARVLHVATTLVSGRVLVTGGTDNKVVFASVELYDRPSNTWTLAKPMSKPRTGHTATLLSDGRVLVAGGLPVMEGFTIPDCELYDPATNTWTPAKSMGVARAGHTATRLPNGKVLVAGGHPGGTDEIPGKSLKSAELYDPVANTWTAVPPMSTERMTHVAALLANGKVLVAGGGEGTAGLAGELYDYVTNTWSKAGAMSQSPYLPAIVFASGKMVLTGGADRVKMQPLAGTERYDPATNAWSAAAPMAQARAAHTAATMTNEQVMVAGGALSFSSFLNSAELYDPVANTWKSAGKMATARAMHTASVLGDGKVLIIGGMGPLGPLASTELFDPSTSATGEPAAWPTLEAKGNCATDFYIAEAALDAGAAPGYWGMEVLLTKEPRQLTGGFNLGGAFDRAGLNPGFGAFALTTAQRVTATINAQPLAAGPIALRVNLLKDNTQHVGGAEGTPTPGAPLTFVADLTPGFYVVQINSTAASERGTFQLGLATTGAFADGVVVGGYLPRDAAGNSPTGFGAFCVPQTQKVKVELFGASLYGANAAGNLVLTLRDYQRNVIGVYR